MKQVAGIWLPDDEQHLAPFLEQGPKVGNRGTYQLAKLIRALRLTRNRRTALDVGAHVGLWTMMMARKFTHVHAFEPVEAMRDCFARNLDGVGNVTLHPCALGAEAGKVQISFAPDNTPGAHITHRSGGSASMETLDSFDLADVDFIKLDCEGYEYFALRGGEALLKRCRPAVCVEQKPGSPDKYGLSPTGALDYLKALGAELHDEMFGDYFLSWPP